jgi:hypothetical protein
VRGWEGEVSAEMCVRACRSTGRVQKDVVAKENKWRWIERNKRKKGGKHESGYLEEDRCSGRGQ